MIKLSLDLGEETTWAQLKRWVDAVEATGEVNPEARIVRDNESYQDIVRERLEVEIRE
jgi:hypothetical protein